MNFSGGSATALFLDTFPQVGTWDTKLAFPFYTAFSPSDQGHICKQKIKIDMRDASIF